jgi:membrane associated rhomboid family serine protease
MRRTMTLSFPPFTTAVKWLVIINASAYLLLILLQLLVPGAAVALIELFALIPIRVTSGWVWQLFTYSFLHAGTFHLLFNMLALWMFGAQFEMDWGRRRFLEYFFFCAIGAAVVTTAISFTGVLRMSPTMATVGASAGVYGLLMAFGLLYGDRQIMLIPFPFLIKARYMIFVWIFLELVATLQMIGGTNNLAHLAGLFLGWAYLKFLPRRGLGFAASERYYGLRNAWYRWKRRRAARKFQVYMRQYEREQYFDEYGNYRGPDKPREKGNGESKSPWVQ